MRALMLLLVACLAAPATADDFDDLIDAERAFAAQAQKIGVRDAFIEYFAEDNLGYGPGPIMGREKWQSRPAATFKLEWSPEAGEIAASGDFGYTFGPWQLRSPDAPEAPPAAGHFFSIWERDAQGRFRNVLDHGIDHALAPLATEAVRRGPPAAKTRAARLSPAATNTRLQSLLAADRELARALATTTGESARKAVASDDIAWLRNGSLPTYGPAAAPTDGAIDAQQLASLRIAASGELAMTTGWNGDAAKAVVYIRVWRHDGRAWQLVVDYLQTPPAA